VAVAFARFSGVLFPWISESRYLIGPIGLSTHYAISLSTAQLVALAVILVLTGTNALGLKYGKWVQNFFTVTKVAALGALIAAGFTIGRSAAAVHENFAHMFTLRSGSAMPEMAGALGLLVAVCVAQSGSLFSADSWHNVTFAAEEVRDPRRVLPRALILGSVLVIMLYLAANTAYLSTLSFTEIQGAAHDRVATAMLAKIFPSVGGRIMALAIMISTFGCINSLILSGARAYYAMARDGLFMPAAAKLNRANVPGASLAMQAIWAGMLVLLTTYSAKAGYGNLYSDLLDYVISAALIFYVLTIAGVVVLRWKKPDAERPYRTFGYPVTPLIYVIGASTIVVCLLVFRPATTWPGLGIVACGAPVYFLIRKRQMATATTTVDTL
jgi:APA family basic amino acid/polyamine antiporter